MYSLGIYKIKQHGDYILIPDLQAGGAVQEEFGGERYLLQLDNVLELKNLKAQPDLVTTFKTLLRHYSKKVSDGAVAHLLEARLVQTVTTRNHSTAREWERTCFIQRETAKLQYWMISIFPSTGVKWIHPKKGVVAEGAGDALIVRKGTPIKTDDL